jgi:branched-chain amino acid transport system substrate-binding protein
MRRFVLPAALLVACACSLTACKKPGSADSGSGDIIIGHFASMTGDTATFGTSADEGIRLALDEVNAKGGVLGRKIKLITEDDQSKADEARTAAEKLISRDKAVALLGEISSSKSIAAAPAAQSAHIPMLSPGSTNPKVTETGDYIFRACFIDPFQGEAMARFALDDLKLKKFAMLYAVNSDYSTGLRDYVKQTLQKRGAQVVAEQSYTESKDVDFKAQLTAIKTAKPDAIFVTGYYTEAGLIAQQARELEITVPLIGGDGWDSDQTVKIGKQAVEGCYFANHYSPDEQRPEVQAFVSAYKAKYKTPSGEPKVPDAMAILGYDAMKLLADAITRANSTEGSKIRDALAATKGFPGAAGAITIDAKRNASKPIVIVKIDHGQFKYVTSIKPQ